MSAITAPEFKTLTINMGPQHPSTHGVLRLVIELDGETVVSLKPVVGYLHTGMEKIMEAKTYTKSITVTDRMDYLSPLGNNMAYVGAVERIMGLEIPERAQVLRVILLELTRISSHLVWLGTHAIDLGAMSVFLYCFREREKLLDVNDVLHGQFSIFFPRNTGREAFQFYLIAATVKLPCHFSVSRSISAGSKR